MSQDAPREISDAPVDREAMRAIGASYDAELDIDYDTASAAHLDALWLELIAPWLSVIPDDAFAAFEREVGRQFDTRGSNIAGVARERAAALLVLITDWRWGSWAAEEVRQGRDPYVAAA